MQYNLKDPLTRTIEDAFQVTKELGYQYLWVDRYCITQHDSVHKSSQVRQMDVIYSQAALTLVAAAGHNPHYGLSGVDEHMRTAQADV